MEDIARPGGGGGGGREGPVFTARHADKYWCSVSSPQRAKPDSDRVIIVIVVRIYKCRNNFNVHFAALFTSNLFLLGLPTFAYREYTRL